MDNSQNIIPEEVKSEIQLIKGLFIKDIYIMFGIYLVGNSFKELIHPMLQTGYIVFLFILGFIVTRQSRDNPQKRLYFTILYKLIKRHSINDYHMPEQTEPALDEVRIYKESE